MSKKKKRKKHSSSVEINVGGNVGGDVFGGNKTITYGIDADQLDRMFSKIHNQIDKRPDDPDVDNKKLHDVVKKVEKEVKKGEDANPNKVERWLGFLASMAYDIFQVTVAALVSPTAGVGKAIQLIAEKAKEEYQ